MALVQGVGGTLGLELDNRLSQIFVFFLQLHYPSAKLRAAVATCRTICAGTLGTIVCSVCCGSSVHGVARLAPLHLSPQVLQLPLILTKIFPRMVELGHQVSDVAL